MTGDESSWARQVLVGVQALADLRAGDAKSAKAYTPRNCVFTVTVMNESASQGVFRRHRGLLLFILFLTVFVVLPSSTTVRCVLSLIRCMFMKKMRKVTSRM